MSDEARHASVVSIFLLAVLSVLVVATALRTRSERRHVLSQEPAASAPRASSNAPNSTAPPATAPPVSTVSAPAGSAATDGGAPSVGTGTIIEPAPSPELSSAMEKFAPYADRVKGAAMQGQFARAVKDFSKTLTPEERVAYGRFLADREVSEYPKDRLLLMIALVQGPLPVGPVRAQLDEVLKEVGAKPAESFAPPIPDPPASPRARSAPAPSSAAAPP